MSNSKNDTNDHQAQTNGNKVGRRKISDIRNSKLVKPDSPPPSIPGLSVQSLLNTKIAEIESNLKQKTTSSLYEGIPNLKDSLNLAVDESELCHEFDAEVIDERKDPQERINQVRKLYIEKIRLVTSLKREDKQTELECKQLIKDHNNVLSKIKLIQKEKNILNERKLSLQDECRTLQRQNKDAIDEDARITSIQKLKMEELSQTFQTTITDISQKMSEHEEDQNKRLEENASLQEKLEQFQKHSSLRGEHFATQLRAKDLELQLINARTEQNKSILEQEKIRSAANLAQLQKMQETEKELKLQLSLYSNKFDSFESALTKSSSMFTQFQERIEKMNATTIKLNKKNIKLRNAILTNETESSTELTRQTDVLKELLELKENKKSHEVLCRSLQQERAEWNKKLQAAAASTTSPPSPLLLCTSSHFEERSSSQQAPTDMEDPSLIKSDTIIGVADCMDPITGGTSGC